MNRRTKDTDENIKDLIRAAFMESYIDDDGLFKSWWSTYHYHIKIGIFGLSNVEIVITLIP